MNLQQRQQRAEPRIEGKCPNMTTRTRAWAFARIVNPKPQQVAS